MRVPASNRSGPVRGLTIRPSRRDSSLGLADTRLCFFTIPRACKLATASKSLRRRDRDQSPHRGRVGTRRRYTARLVGRHSAATTIDQHVNGVHHAYQAGRHGPMRHLPVLERREEARGSRSGFLCQSVCHGGLPESGIDAVSRTGATHRRVQPLEQVAATLIGAVCGALMRAGATARPPEFVTPPRPTGTAGQCRAAPQSPAPMAPHR